MSKLPVVVFTAVAFCVNAEAKETKLRVKDHGVLGAMQRMGCRVEWFSVVLKQSNLLESQLNSLRRGTPIIAPDECGEKPPVDDRKVTALVFEQESQRQSAKETEESLRSQLNEKQTEIGKLDIKLADLKKEMSARVKHAEEVARTAEKIKNSSRWWNISFGALLGAIIASGAGGLFLFLRARRLKNVPGKDDTFSVEYHGDIIRFTDMSTQFAGCPYCSEKRLRPSAKNLYQHLDKHPHLRVVERSVEEIGKLLVG
jgi:FtsZ-binding cell division protein ZapB